MRIRAFFIGLIGVLIVFFGNQWAHASVSGDTASDNQLIVGLQSLDIEHEIHVLNESTRRDHGLLGKNEEQKKPLPFYLDGVVKRLGKMNY